MTPFNERRVPFESIISGWVRAFPVSGGLVEFQSSAKTDGVDRVSTWITNFKGGSGILSPENLIVGVTSNR